MDNQFRQILLFPFQSREGQTRYWIGVGLFFLGFIIPIIPWIFVGGYLMRLLRHTIQGEALTPPAWDDWGELALDGLRQMVVFLVFLLPGIVVFIVGQGLYFFSFFAFTLSAEAGEPESLVGLLTLFGSMAILFISMAVSLLLSLLGLIPLPAALAHCAAKQSLAAAFRFGEWWRLLQVNKWGYFTAWVLVVGLGVILSLPLTLAYYTLVLACLFPFLAALLNFYLGLIQAVLFGRFYRESLGLATPDAEVSL